MSLYPSLEELMVSKVADQKEPIESVKNTYLNKTNAKTNSKMATITVHPQSLYGDLNSMLSQEEYDEVRNYENSIVKTNTSQELTPTERIQQSASHHDGLREVLVVRKNNNMGIGFVMIDNVYYIAFVEKHSGASDSNLRFGDQVVRINSLEMEGVNKKTVLKYISEIPESEPVHLIIRDRPLQRTFKLHKDHTNIVGLVVEKGSVSKLLKDSSASRNGVPINHQIIEVNSQNVIGLPDKEIITIIKQSVGEVMLGLMPIRVYKSLISGVSRKKIKNDMDHSVIVF